MGHQNLGLNNIFEKKLNPPGNSHLFQVFLNPKLHDME